MSPGPLQILLVLLVIGLVIGPSRIARMARSLGRGAYDFIDELGSSKEEKDEHRDKRELDDEAPDDRHKENRSS